MYTVLKTDNNQLFESSVAIIINMLLSDIVGMVCG